MIVLGHGDVAGSVDLSGDVDVVHVGCKAVFVCGGGVLVDEVGCIPLEVPWDIMTQTP